MVFKFHVLKTSSRPSILHSSEKRMHLQIHSTPRGRSFESLASIFRFTRKRIKLKYSPVYIRLPSLSTLLWIYPMHETWDVDCIIMPPRNTHIHTQYFSTMRSRYSLNFRIYAYMRTSHFFLRAKTISNDTIRARTNRIIHFHGQTYTRRRVECRRACLYAPRVAWNMSRIIFIPKTLILFHSHRASADVNARRYRIYARPF